MDYLLPVAAGRGLRDRHRPRAGRAGEHRLPDAASSPATVIAHIHVNWLAPVKVRRTLIGGSQQDDRLRRPRAEREDQGLRQGHHRERRADRRPRARQRPALPDAGRLPHRRHVGAAARHDRGARPSRPGTSSTASTNNKTPITDGHAGLRVVRHARSRHRIDARPGPHRRASRQWSAPHDSVSSISRAQYLEHQAGDRRRHRARPRERPVRPRPGSRGASSRSSPPTAAPTHGDRRELRHQRAAPGAARRRRRARATRSSPCRSPSSPPSRRSATPARRRSSSTSIPAPSPWTSTQIEAAITAADQGHPAGPSLRPGRRHGSDPGRSRRATAWS